MLTCPTSSVCYRSTANAGDMRSTDGGATWSTFRIVHGNSGSLASLTCWSADGCTGLSSWGALIATTDGFGSVTTQLVHGGQAPRVAACGSPSMCVVAGWNAGPVTVAITTDGGGSWQAQTLSPDGSPRAAACASVQFCVIGGDGFLVSTRDGGQTWAAAAVPSNASYRSIACSTSSTCVAVDPYNPGVWQSSDLGATWHGVSASGDQFIQPQAIACPTATTCVVGGNDGIQSYAQTVHLDGRPAEPLSAVPPGINGLREIACSGSHCIATGFDMATSNRFAMVASDDSGQSWSSVPSSTGSSASGIACPSIDHCVVVGQSTTSSAGVAATTRITTDGGDSWHLGTTPAGLRSLTRVACATDAACVAIGLGPPQAYPPVALS